MSIEYYECLGSYRPFLYRAYLRFQDWALTRILYDKEHRMSREYPELLFIYLKPFGRCYHFKMKLFDTFYYS
jgi:hypothetical protein